jgi:hypothetical protein
MKPASIRTRLGPNRRIACLTQEVAGIFGFGSLAIGRQADRKFAQTIAWDAREKLSTRGATAALSKLDCGVSIQSLPDRGGDGAVVASVWWDRYARSRSPDRVLETGET